MDPLPLPPPPYVGRHLLIDLYGASNLADCEYIEQACRDAAVATGATIIGSTFHPFGEGYGVSGVCVLAESHLSTHTWPEYGVATFDVYVCGSCDPRLAVPVLEERFKPSKAVVEMHERGRRLDD